MHVGGGFRPFEGIPVRRTLVLVSCCLLGGAVRPVASQMFMTDARRIGMGGLSLTIDGRLSRYNPAYGAVPPSAAPGGAKVTIPLPLASRWGDSTDVAIESKQIISRERVLDILIEKDFKCLHSDRTENADAFENPNECGKP